MYEASGDSIGTHMHAEFTNEMYEAAIGYYVKGKAWEKAMELAKSQKLSHMEVVVQQAHSNSLVDNGDIRALFDVCYSTTLHYTTLH